MRAIEHSPVLRASALRSRARLFEGWNDTYAAKLQSQCARRTLFSHTTDDDDDGTKSCYEYKVTINLQHIISCAHAHERNGMIQSVLLLLVFENDDDDDDDAFGTCCCCCCFSMLLDGVRRCRWHVYITGKAEAEKMNGITFIGNSYERLPRFLASMHVIPLWFLSQPYSHVAPTRTPLRTICVHTHLARMMLQKHTQPSSSTLCSCQY